jgi:hypothetical protein
LFDEGSVEIKIRAMLALYRFVKVSGIFDSNLSAYSHFNDAQIFLDPRYKDSWDLLAARTVIILKYLNQKGKILIKRFCATGYGGTRPVKPNKMELHRRANLRVEIVIANKTDTERR